MGTLFQLVHWRYVGLGILFGVLLSVVIWLWAERFFFKHGHSRSILKHVVYARYPHEARKTGISSFHAHHVGLSSVYTSLKQDMQAGV